MLFLNCVWTQVTCSSILILNDLILGKGEEGSKERALHLLSLLKEAGHLTKQKNVQHRNEVVVNSQFVSCTTI
jgi:hypothetical protein